MAEKKEKAGGAVIKAVSLTAGFWVLMQILAISTFASIGSIFASPIVIWIVIILFVMWMLRKRR